ncbi:MAG: hypothetical protein H6643_00270 [Caldilineaceae bacterium]|nr:hypothetical protein [Caldilineaceae bacterium]
MAARTQKSLAGRLPVSAQDVAAPSPDASTEASPGFNLRHPTQPMVLGRRRQGGVSLGFTGPSAPAPPVRLSAGNHLPSTGPHGIGGAAAGR